MSVAVATNEMGASGGVIVLGALHSMTGGVVSTTLMICTQLAALSHESVAVQVRRFEEREEGPILVDALILVERESQKGIIIGRRGQMLKQIGSAARQEIERLLEQQVYLDLWVKTRYKWRRDVRELRRLGYSLPQDE